MFGELQNVGTVPFTFGGGAGGAFSPSLLPPRIGTITGSYVVLRPKAGLMRPSEVIDGCSIGEDHVVNTICFTYTSDEFRVDYLEYPRMACLTETVV